MYVSKTVHIIISYILLFPLMRVNLMW